MSEGNGKVIDPTANETESLNVTPASMDIILTWDPLTQGVGIKFDREKFKTWGFVKAVLLMAADLCDAQARTQQAMNMQQQLAQAGQAQALANNLRMRRG